MKLTVDRIIEVFHEEAELDLNTHLWFMEIETEMANALSVEELRELESQGISTVLLEPDEDQPFLITYLFQTTAPAIN